MITFIGCKQGQYYNLLFFVTRVNFWFLFMQTILMVGQEFWKLIQAPHFFYGVRGIAQSDYDIRRSNVTGYVTPFYIYSRGILSLLSVSAIYILALMNCKIIMAEIEEMQPELRDPLKKKRKDFRFRSIQESSMMSQGEQDISGQFENYSYQSILKGEENKKILQTLNSIISQKEKDDVFMEHKKKI